MKLLTEIIKDCSYKYGSRIALKDEYTGYVVTYRELYNDVLSMASALQHFGVVKGTHIAMFSENCSPWFMVDRAIMMTGGVSAVRGSLAPKAELEYIYDYGDCEALVTDSLTLIDDLKDILIAKNTKFVIYIGKKELTTDNLNGIPVMSFRQMLDLGIKLELKPVELSEDDLCTLIFTSGTTGKPKGAMLTHGNFASQVEVVHEHIYLKEGKTALLILPIWHAYERTCEYYATSIGITLCYTNVKNLKKDLPKYAPHYMFCVPRIWESIYSSFTSEIEKKPFLLKNFIKLLLAVSKVRVKSRRIAQNRDIYHPHPGAYCRFANNMLADLCFPLHALANKMIYSKFHKALGGRFIRGISGGGALGEYLDDFLETIDVEIYEGYGLTETSPVLSVRTDSNRKALSAGVALPRTRFLIVNPENYQPVKQGEKGMVMVKGPQVMKGYYKDPEATKKVLLANGFFATGDIGWLTDDGALILTGRMKDTIVLSNGENIEPESIEQSCMTSPFVKQVVLTGQDKEYLSALIVPDMNAISEYAKKKNISNPLANQEFKNEVLKDIRDKVQKRTCYRAFERIADIAFVDEEFTPENGMMTQTAKIKKNVVLQKYADKIESMYR